MKDYKLSEIITSTEIAKLENVTLGAVSNWAKRHADFPRAVAKHGTTSFYERSEVLRWLDEREPHCRTCTCRTEGH